MRKLNEATLVTLDGAIENASSWANPFLDDEFERDSLRQLLICDAFLMGRRTYDFFAKVWPQRSGAFPDRINTMQKYVFSSTLERAEWNNTAIVRGNVVEELRKLKGSDGGELMMYGHTQLGRAALEANLLDELKVSIFPVVAGEGHLRFYQPVPRSGLSLVSTKVFSTGVVSMTYRLNHSDVSS